VRYEGVGRGEVATRDMTLRITALRAQGADLIDVLWDRYIDAVLGDGFTYEYATGDTREYPDR
jgi:hypothetical protein